LATSGKTLSNSTLW